MAALLVVVALGGGQGAAGRGLRSCAGPDRVVRVHVLRGFLIHDGLVSDRGCALLLVGEQVAPTLHGAILASGDGGRSLRTVATFPRALHVWRIVRSGRTLWAVGDRRPGGGLLLRSARPSGPWTPVRLPARIESLSAAAPAPGSIWLAGQRQTAEGIEAVVLRWSTSRGRFEVAARVRPSLGRPAHLRTIAASGRSVIAAGSDGVLGVVLASSDGGSRFARVPLMPRPTIAAGAATVGARRMYATGSLGSPTRVAAMRGVIFSGFAGGPSWRARRMPGTVQLGDVTFPTSRVGYVVTVTRTGSGVAVTHDAGGSWSQLPFRGRGVTLERLLAGDVVYAVGPSGLFRLGSPN
jgi:hypothetical protein